MKNKGNDHTILGSNAEKTKYLPELEIAKH